MKKLKRDIKYYLNARKKTGTTTATTATAGELTGTVAIPGTIDLSVKYLLNLQDGEDGNFQEIDCRGATPGATTLAEIIANINAAVGRTMASVGAGNYLVLTGNGTGKGSTFTIKPPNIDSDKDCLQDILGLSALGIYKYTYTGDEAWIKIAEFDIGASTTVITNTEIRDIDERDTWTGGSDSIKLLGGPLTSIVDETYNKIVKDQTDFNNLFERTGAGTYQFKDEITSVYFKTGTSFNISGILESGDTSAIISTNNCKLIDAEGVVQILWGSTEGYLDIDTANCIIKNIEMRGDNSTVLTSTATFYINGVSNVSLYNCTAIYRLGTARGFSASATGLRTRFINCLAFGMGGYGFYSCENLVNCYAENNGLDGFYSSKNLTNCTSGSNSGSGFGSCNYISNCTSTSSSNYGFTACSVILNCAASSEGIHGFNACSRVSNSTADSCSGSGFKSCSLITSCYSASNTLSGFESCSSISSSFSQNNTIYGFNLCTYVAAGCRSTGSGSANWNTAYGTLPNTVDTCSGSEANGGNPLFNIIYEGTIVSLAFSGTIAHGITTPATNERIISCTASCDNSTVGGGTESFTGKRQFQDCPYIR
jgi:hypothetical protein